MSNQFKFTVLGSGSALPKKDRFQAAHLLEVHNKLFLIDCGEGMQIQAFRLKYSLNRLGHIFISHLHADHCLGLIGLISSLGMTGHYTNIEIHSAPELEKLLKPQLDFFCQELGFEVIFHPFNPRKKEIIFEDRTLIVKTLPLKHRVPTCGFIFEEKPKERHLIPEMIDAFNIPIKERALIKKGKDFITEEGETIENKRLTKEPSPSKKFVYCSDTAFLPKIVPDVENADCLFHEATFLEEEALRAKKTYHSTAKQAATIALEGNVKKLIIGHFSSRYPSIDPIVDEAKSIFPYTIAAKDGLQICF